MSTLIAPRYELPLVDANGRMSREWYKFLIQIANSIDRSGTSYDDIVTLQSSDGASSDAIAVEAMNVAQFAVAGLLLHSSDEPQPVDTTLLALWPGDNK